ALVLMGHDGAAGGVAAQRGPAHGVVDVVVARVDEHAFAERISRRGGERLALVDPVHRLGHEVLAEITGVGDRAALAAGLRVAGTGGVGALVGIPVVPEGGQVAVAFIGEGEQFQQVVIVDAPVHLGAPEPVLALALVPGGAGVAGVLGIRVAKLVHREQEQAVADQGTRSPDIGLVEAAAVAAAPVDRGGGGAVRVFAGDDPVLARSLPRVGFEGQLDATFELVAS